MTNRKTSQRKRYRRRHYMVGGANNATCNINDSSVFCPSCPGSSSSGGSGTKPSGTSADAYGVGGSGTGATVPPSWLQQLGSWWSGKTALFTTARSNPVASNLQLQCPNGACISKSTSSGNLANPNVAVSSIMGEEGANPPLYGDLNLTGAAKGAKMGNQPIYRMRAGSRKRRRTSRRMTRRTRKYRRGGRR